MLIQYLNTNNYHITTQNVINAIIKSNHMCPYTCPHTHTKPRSYPKCLMHTTIKTTLKFMHAHTRAHTYMQISRMHAIIQIKWDYSNINYEASITSSRTRLKSITQYNHVIIPTWTCNIADSKLEESYRILCLLQT